MKVLVIEDENIAVQRLVEMLSEIDREIEVTCILDSVEASISYLELKPIIDLVFMDIELGDGLSFDIFNKATIDVPVIFITAYQEHALKAFKQNSIDYLLKPLNKKELATAISKYKKIHGRDKAYLQKNIIDYLKSAKELSSGKDRFLAKTGTRLITVPVESIAYFYTKDKFQYIKTSSDEDLIIDKPLDQIEAEIDTKIFFRANRQFVIKYSSIQKVHAGFSGKLKVQVQPVSYEEIIISRLKAAEFKKWLGE